MMYVLYILNAFGIFLWIYIIYHLTTYPLNVDMNTKIRMNIFCHILTKDEVLQVELMGQVKTFQIILLGSVKLSSQIVKPIHSNIIWQCAFPNYRPSIGHYISLIFAKLVRKKRCSFLFSTCIYFALNFFHIYWPSVDCSLWIDCEIYSTTPLGFPLFFFVYIRISTMSSHSCCKYFCFS